MEKSLWRTNLKGRWHSWSLSPKDRIILPLVSDGKLERSYRKIENIGSWACVSNFTITKWKACLWIGSTQRKRGQRWRKKSPCEAIWAAESSHIKNQIYLRFFTNMRFYLPSLCLNNAFGLVGLSFVLVNKRILKSTRTIRIPVPQTSPGTQ